MGYSPPPCGINFSSEKFADLIYASNFITLECHVPWVQCHGHTIKGRDTRWRIHVVEGSLERVGGLHWHLHYQRSPDGSKTTCCLPWYALPREMMMLQTMRKNSNSNSFCACLVQFAHNNCKMFEFVQPQKSTTPKPMLLCEEGQ